MREYKALLVPYDGSPLSKKAMEKALSLAKAFKSEVTVIYVEEPIKSSWGPDGVEERETSWLEYLAREEGGSEEILKEAGLIAKERGIKIRTVHVKGHAANEIAKASKEFDLIVMGTHGRSGIEHLLIGSVAEKVARHACCPVLLIREKPCEII